MNNRLIIENATGGELTDIEVLDYVAAVMSRGRISDNGKQYCYGNLFNNGVSVSCFKNKCSDRFVVWLSAEWGNE